MPLNLVEQENRLVLVDGAGVVVGRFSRNFSIPQGMAFHSGRIAAIVVRKKEDSEAEFHSHIRSDTWELVVPELVFVRQS
jgi:ATP-dependent DNA helicase RecQ